ncbi:MAG: endonuclease III [Candidatus Micrarchaeota archaeon]|nr:endonuclease III [Candidatus Micrarchaeota archaeon]MDE1848218.1 endonuclease III [Candidatus Micrarchaeota archaeon]MDE1864896.1 endonuclease III [Candidatus Micrarchaeota archaeon]
MPQKPPAENASRKAIELLAEEYPNAKYYLNFSTPTDLVVAAIISAQTRDEVVNSVTPELFKKFKTAKDYANADVNQLVAYIKKVSFSGNKAKNIIAACKILQEKYKGRIPDNIEELMDLPGIGKKTANTILINAYGIVNGIPVDTWVIKLSNRIGLSINKDPDKIEQDLMKVVDKKYWGKFAYILKSHGKKICQSQVPICSKCLLSKLCPRNGVTKSA